MLKSEAAAYLAGVTQTEGAEASAPTNLHVITGEVGEASADGKTLVKIDGLMFSESDDQFIEVDALGGLEEGDVATIVLTGEQGHAMTPLALGSIGSVDRITVRIAAIEADYIKVEQLDAATARIGELEADHVSVDDLNAATARIGTLETTRATITDLEAAEARIGDLEADHVSTDDLDAATARIGTLETNTADIGTIRANSAKVQNLTAAELEADHAAIEALDSNYAHITNGVIDNATIGYADVNNLSAHYAEIQNGKINSALIDTAAIVDEQVFTVTGNKATLAQIDASKINVLNLKAKDIEVERINGQPVTNKTLVDALSQHETDISGLDTKIDNEVEALNDRIDGAIETFTGTVVPTLNNTPASQWNTVALKDQHVGDVYYVVNSQSAQNGYCYRFTKSGSTYSWQLIKDSDVTAALSRLQTAEGKIGDIETFDETVGSFMTNTNDEISSLKTKDTQLETSLGDKVSTSTFNTVSQKVDANEANITSMSTVLTNNGLTSSTNITNTVNTVKQTATGNSSKITQLTTTLGTNADGTTKAGDVVHRTSAVEQDLSGITTRVGTLESTTTAHGTRLTNAETSISQNAEDITLRATKTEVQQVRPAYASSSTAAGTAAKVATIDPAVTGYALYKGATVAVTFSTANTAATPTLNLNSTGAKQIRSYTGAALSEAEYKWAAGATIDLVYDGTYWRMQDGGSVKRVTAAEASIRVNADNIESKVSKDGVISSINQSAETVKIQASKVEIDGTAIFSAISSDVDDAITDKGYQTASQVNSAITSKGYATTTQAQGYASTAKSEAISAAATDATTKANAAEANAKAYTDALEVGGRNLLLGTAAMKSGTGGWNTGTFRASGGTLSNVTTTGLPLPSVSGALRVANNGSSAANVGFAQDGISGLVAGEAYTESGWIRASAAMEGYFQPIWRSSSQVTVPSNNAAGKRFNLTTDWQWFSWTGTLNGEQASTYSGGYAYAVSVPVGGWFEVCGLKLEKGNKATDWTPAPEDVAADIAAAQATANAAAPKANAVKRTQRIWYRTNGSSAPATPGTASSNWVTKADDGNDAWTKMHIAINSTHKYIYTCEQYEMANGTVGYTSVLLDNTITVIDGGNIITGSVTANKLNAANINASKTLTVGAMTDAAASTILNSNVQVGGRNLLPWSSPSAENLAKIASPTTYNSFVTEDGYSCYKITSASTNGAQYASNGKSLVKLIADTTYTYSAWVKVATTGSDTSVSLNFYSLGHFTVFNSASAASDKTHEDVAAKRIYSPSTVTIGEWTNITLTFTTNSLDGSTFGVYPKHNLGDAYTLYIRDQKLEKGNKATDWTPAPEDQTAYVDDSISSLQVGGRNLLYDTSGWSKWAKTTKATEADDVLTCVNTDTSSGFQRANGWFIPDKTDVMDREIVISFDAKKTDSTALSSLVFQMFTTSAAPKSVASGSINEGTRVYQSLGAASTDRFVIENANSINATTWTRVSLRFIPSVVFNQSYTEQAYLAVYIGINNTVASAQFRHIKAEYGNKATDWSPAPEDQTAYVNETAYQSAQPNLSPFFSITKDDVYNASTNPTGYWKRIATSTQFTTYEMQVEHNGSEGWAHFAGNATSGNPFVRFEPVYKAIKPSTTYTFLAEVDGTFNNSSNVNLAFYNGTGQTDAIDPFSASLTINVKDGGMFYRTGKTRSDVSASAVLNRGYLQVYGTGTFDCYIRLSLYEGEYTGPYKPYSGDQLYATNSALAGTNESLEGAIEDIGELSDQLVGTVTEQNRTITDIQTYLNSLRKDLDAEIQSRQQWLNFNSAEGLVIGAAGSTFKTVTTNTSQQFRSGGTVLAETSGTEFVAPVMRSDQLLIGNWMWTRRDNGNLSLKWIG